MCLALSVNIQSDCRPHRIVSVVPHVVIDHPNDSGIRSKRHEVVFPVSLPAVCNVLPYKRSRTPVRPQTRDHQTACK